MYHQNHLIQEVMTWIEANEDKLTANVLSKSPSNWNCGTKRRHVLKCISSFIFFCIFFCIFFFIICWKVANIYFVSNFSKLGNMHRTHTCVLFRRILDEPNVLHPDSSLTWFLCYNTNLNDHKKGKNSLCEGHTSVSFCVHA